MNRLDPVVDEDGLHYVDSKGRIFREPEIRKMSLRYIGGSRQIMLVDPPTGEYFEIGPVLNEAFRVYIGSCYLSWYQLACDEWSAKASRADTQNAFDWSRVYGPKIDSSTTKWLRGAFESATKRPEEDKEKSFPTILEGRCTFCGSKAYVGIYTIDCPRGCRT